MTLNILLSFAAFERDLVGERTRDKMWAAKKKGKWVGGYPPLGYDVAPGGGRLVVNQAEAQRVRWIFTQTAKLGGLRPVLAAIQARGWRTKSWRTGAGVVREGVPFSAAGLGRLLRNPVYRGAVNWHGQLQAGEHEPIIAAELWERVNTMKAAPPGTGPRRYRAEAPLRGLLYCAGCQCPMVATSTRKKDRQYRYYVCLRAQKQDEANCSSKALRAQEIEEAVWQQIGEILPAANFNFEAGFAEGSLTWA